MTWTPETNRIPFGLLTDEEMAALKACERGWEGYIYQNYSWATISDPDWFFSSIYRAKPAPKRIVTWHNVYAEHIGASCCSREKADRYMDEDRLCVYRIERNEDGSDPQIFVEET